jgi:peptide/nickel transport system substrate-binding protein
LCIAVALLVGQPFAVGSTPKIRSGGFVRVALRAADVPTVDPALVYSEASATLMDTTCARLLAYSQGGRPRLEPEVATGFPRASRDRTTFTFTLRPGFRFSDGEHVRADAFARAINRILAPSFDSPLAQYMSDISGADDVLAGRATRAAGVAARGNRLTVHLARPLPDFPARATFLCAVPPALPADPEGAGASPAAGPYYVAEYHPGEKVVLRRNRFYGGKRPHHVDGFTVDLSVSSFDEVLDRIEGNAADWGWAPGSSYFSPQRRLAARYGVNKSRFFLSPGFEFRGYVMNASRPLFRNNARLRRAVNFAIDRAALSRIFGGPLVVRPTDQYLPPRMPGYEDARIYPLGGPDLRRARALARGHIRSGKAVLYVPNRPEMLTAAQSIKHDLAKIGLNVEIEGIPIPAYFDGRLGSRGPYDIGFMPWIPDYLDPYAVLNVLFDGRFIGANNWARFNSINYNRLLREAALLQGGARYRAYGKLDVSLASIAAPMVPVAVLNTPTLVSSRLGCVKAAFDLAAVCLK